MVTVLANKNWPAVAIEADFQNGPPNTPTTARKSINAAYRNVAVPRFSIARGRQYELDKVSAGTFTAEVRDPFENLNPDNPVSPFNTGGNSVLPERAGWCWAMWPNQPGSGNIINTSVHADYDPSFEANPDGALGLWSAAGGTTTLAQSTAQAFDGTHSLLVTQSAAGAGFGAVNTFRTVPGLTYTFSVYVLLTVQAGLSVTVQVVDAAGAAHTSTSTTTQGSWQRLTVTWTTVDTLEAITIYGTGTSTPTFYIDATMLEFGATAGTFTTSGPVLYPLWTGYIERWPTTYDMAGFRATHKLSGIDALAVLSRTAINQSYTATITANGPIAYAPMSNSKPATSGGALSTGSETARITGSNITGNPVYHPSASGNINWGGDSQPDSIPAVVLQQNNAYNPPKAGHVTATYPNEQQTTFDVFPVNLTVANTGATIEMWAKFSSGVVVLAQLLSTAVHGGGLNLELGFGAANTQNHIELYTGSGNLLFHVVDAANGFSNVYNVSNNTIVGAGFPDGQWHYYAIVFYNASGAPGLALRYDGVEFLVTAPTSAINYGFTNLHHEVSSDFGDVQSQASIARFAVYNRDIGSTARGNHYQRGVGYLGEISGARVTRLLNQYWAGSINVANGYMALAPDFSYDPTGTGSQSRVMLDVLQEIQDSERGLIYAGKNGTVVFEDRTTRYTNGQTALWVFGEHATSGEYPYTDYATDKDPTYTFSQANLTSQSNGNFAPVINPATQNAYGQRILTQTVQCVLDFDLTQAGIYYTQRYATPTTRISKLTLDPGSNPALWPVVLSLEISQRVTVRRRNAGVTVARDYYVEKISHKVDGETPEWLVDLQLSPVFVPSAWVLGDTTYGVLGTTTTPVY